MDIVNDGANCTHFMRLYLSLVDELKIRGLDSVQAADMGLSWMTQFFMFSCNKDFPGEVQMGFIPDPDNDV